jgi:ribosomal-protein-alanine N-acetyltransferase
VPCDLPLLDAAVHDGADLARALDCVVADGWAVFPEAMQIVRDAIAADPAGALWGPRLFVVDAPRTLVGWGGFKGRPDDDGTVEIGYAVAPGWEGRDVATAAVGLMLDEAWADPAVRRVCAHTLPERNASVRVLEKSGLRREGENLDGDVGVVWRFCLDRPDTPKSVPSSADAAGA